MRQFDRFKISGARPVLFATIVLVCLLAAIAIPVWQSFRNSIHPIVQSVRNYIYPILNFRSTAVTQPLIDTSMIVPDDAVWEMLGQVNQDRALIDLRRLTGEIPICVSNKCATISNRLSGSVGLQWAEEYIVEELDKLGYSVVLQDWSLSGYSDHNIIARKPGKLSPGEEIYFVAHLDGARTGVAEQFPAADDDASGVADILEMARILSSFSFHRTLVLFFSTGEEQGTLGVISYLDQLSPEELRSIMYVVDVDMVGYDKNQDAVMELWHGGDVSSLALTQIMGAIIQTYQIGLAPSFVIGCG